MKIGLIGLNSQFVHSALALYYLRETAPSFCQCTIKEYSVNDPILDIFYDITSQDWDILAFSLYIWNKETALKLLPLLKKTFPNIIFVLGGPEPTYSPQDFAQGDYIVYGALENTWPQLLEGIKRGEVPELPGLQGQPQFAGEWAFPYNREDLQNLKHRLVYYETSRGCPYQCGFCLSAPQKDIGFLPMDRVKQELDFFINAQISVVKLVDRTFNYPPQRAKEIMTYLMSRPNCQTTFHFELKGELIDEEMLSLFLAAPKDLFQVEIGIQTLNEDALGASHRKNHWEKTKEIYRLLGQADNVHTHFDLIAGLPYEDYQSFQYSFSEAMSIFPSHMQLGFLKLLPGTPFAPLEDNHGYIAQSYPPYEVVANKYISQREMGELKKIDKFIDRYYNKGNLTNLFRFAMDAWPATLYQLFHGLAISNEEPTDALTRLMPEQGILWQSLGRFDKFIEGRKVQVTEEEEKSLRYLLNEGEELKKLLPHYGSMPHREIYKRLRLGMFPVAFKAEGQKLVGWEPGETKVIFDYKVKTNKKSEQDKTDFYIL